MGGGVQNLEFQYLGGGGFRKMNFVLGMKILWIFFGSSQKRTSFMGYFFAFKGLFLRSKYRMGIFFGVAKISNFLLDA